MNDAQGGMVDRRRLKDAIKNSMIEGHNCLRSFKNISEKMHSLTCNVFLRGRVTPCGPIVFPCRLGLPTQ